MPFFGQNLRLLQHEMTTDVQTIQYGRFMKEINWSFSVYCSKPDIVYCSRLEATTHTNSLPVRTYACFTVSLYIFFLFLHPLFCFLPLPPSLPPSLPLPPSFPPPSLPPSPLAPSLPPPPSLPPSLLFLLPLSSSSNLECMWCFMKKTN